MFGFVTVIVYPSALPPGTVAESAVLVVARGRTPVGENVMMLESVAVAEGASVIDQLSPAPLSRFDVHRQVSGNGRRDPIVDHTVEYRDSR